MLSGGGARGLAHIGALAALRDAGVAIDRLGGTSMGAFIASLCAMGASVQEISAIARREFVQQKPFGDYVWPKHSIIRARRAGALLTRVFGEEIIEQQPRTLYCVSTDLVAAQEVVHRRGRIAAAVARSMSLPGIAPPIRSAAALHVDGGVLNNLPVDVMTAEDEGPVIAVDVMRPFDGPPVGLPGIVETITRSMVLGSWRKVEANRALAQVLIAPRLDSVALFDFARLDEIVRLGRQSADEALARVDIGAL